MVCIGFDISITCRPLDYIEDAAAVAVDGGDFFGTGSPGLPNHCKFLVKAEWSTAHASFFDVRFDADRDCV